MLKKYNGFLLEKFTNSLFLILEGYISSSSDFLSKLKEISKSKDNAGKIASCIIRLIDDQYYFNDDNIKQNFFNTTDKEDMISFLQNSKLPNDWDLEDDAALPYSMKGRGEIKVGRIIRYLIDLINKDYDLDEEFGFKPSDKDIEQFVNLYKSIKSNDSVKFKIVKGDDIAKYYNKDSYYLSTGTLGGSCMRECEDAIFNIYTENPKKVALLIYVDEEDKIHGRALLWKLKESPCDAKYFMDRIYVNRDSDELKFRKFADENGFMYKKKMNSHTDTNVLFVYKGTDVAGEIKVKLDCDYKKYPFLDTLSFMDEKKSYLSNLSFKDSYLLNSTYGDCDYCTECKGQVKYCYNCENEGKVNCWNCDGASKSDKKKCEYCEGSGELICSHCEGVPEICNSCSYGHLTLQDLGIQTDFNNIKKKKKK